MRPYKHATYFPCEAAAGVRFKENNFVRFDAEVRFKKPSKLSGVRFKYKIDNIRLGTHPGEPDNRTIGRPIVRFTNERPVFVFEIRHRASNLGGGEGRRNKTGA